MLNLENSVTGHLLYCRRVALITVSILMLTSLQFLVSFLQFLGYISLSTRTITLECSFCTFYK
ncbi:unnamed protein product [Brassica napus]|uniref:(rape) hypothetical protein n=2 Tax=Brassica napus TaxID=3708 RepID=A0A816YIG1_BRANA|nr:unnamed protein product [Brassica napus]